MRRRRLLTAAAVGSALAALVGWAAAERNPSAAAPTPAPAPPARSTAAPSTTAASPASDAVPAHVLDEHRVGGLTVRYLDSAGRIRTLPVEQFRR